MTLMSESEKGKKKQIMAESYERVFDKHALLEDPVKWYFNSIEDFIDSIESNQHILNIIIFYLYMKIEYAQRRILYTVLIRDHYLNKEKVKEIIYDLRMEQRHFYEIYNILSPIEINQEARDFMEESREIRNSIMHGNYDEFSPESKENAISAIFDYAVSLNAQVKEHFKFEPFGKLEEIEEVKEGFNADETIVELEDLQIIKCPAPSKKKCLAKCLQK